MDQEDTIVSRISARKGARVIVVVVAFLVAALSLSVLFLGLPTERAADALSPDDPTGVASLEASEQSGEPGLAAQAPAPSATPTAVSSDQPDTEAPASAPTWLTYPAAGIDMAITPLTPTPAEVESQSLVPPLTKDLYWLTPFGAPGEGSDDTTYLTGHSWDDQAAPMNSLSTQAAVGDTITVRTEAGTVEYTVDSVTTHDKDTLRTSDIWAISPHRLVLISCYTEDLWGRNIVVTAMPSQ